MVVCGYIVDKYGTDNQCDSTDRFINNKLKFHKGDNKGELEAVFASGIMHMNWNKIFNLDIIRKYNIRYKPYSVNEDFIFVLNYLLHCKSITFIDDCLYHWIRRKGVVSGVESMPDNIIAIYEESHELLADFLQDVIMADRIMHRTYEMVIYKYFYAYRNGIIGEDTCFSQLKKMHASKLVSRTFKVENATTIFTKLICILHSVGWFKLSFWIHKSFIWR